MLAVAILDFGKTVAEKLLTLIFQVSVALPEHRSVIVLLVLIIVLQGVFLTQGSVLILTGEWDYHHYTC